METIKDFFKHINYRLSSPLIFSFVISWVFWNWPVTVGLIIHDKDLLRVDGYNSYINLIKQSVSVWTGLIWPVIFAFAYTVLNPVISSWIQEFYTYIESKSEERQLKRLQGGKISVDKYIRLREDIVKKGKLLEDVIEKESGAIVELTERNSEILKLKNDINDLNSKLNQTQIQSQNYNNKLSRTTIELDELRRNRKTIDFLTDQFFGRWVNEYHIVGENYIRREFELFNIENDIWYINGEKAFSIKEAVFIDDLQVLKFNKTEFKTGRSFSNVTLIKLNRLFWIGLEIIEGKNEYAHLRYYPETQKPKNLFTAFTYGDVSTPEGLMEITSMLKKGLAS